MTHSISVPTQLNKKILSVVAFIISLCLAASVSAQIPTHIVFTGNEQIDPYPGDIYPTIRDYEPLGIRLENAKGYPNLQSIMNWSAIRPLKIVASAVPLNNVTVTVSNYFGNLYIIARGSFGSEYRLTPYRQKTDITFSNNGIQTIEYPGFVGCPNCILDGHIHGIAFDTISTKPDLSLSNIRVTQAVFNSDIDGDGVADLVKDRKTAILADVELLQGEVSDTIMLGGQYTDSLGSYDLEKRGFSFEAGKKIKRDFPLFFIPENEGEIKISLTVDVDNVIDETDEENNSNKDNPVLAKVHETRMLGLELFLLGIDQCNSPVYFTCNIPPVKINKAIDEIPTFIQERFPIRDNGIQLSASSPNEILQINSEAAKSRDGLIYKIISGINKGKNILVDNRFYKDAKLLRRFRINKKYLPVAFVTDNYFDTLGEVTEGAGIAHGGAAFVNVNRSGVNQIIAHEVGHVLGLYPWSEGEAYEQNDPGFPAEGYNVYQALEVTSALAFMGRVGVTDNWWVNSKDWNNLFIELSTNVKDPDVLDISGRLSPFGNITLLPLGLYAGFPDRPQNGDYKLILLDRDGNQISDHPLEMHYTIELHGLGIGLSDVGTFWHSILLPNEAAELLILGPDGKTLLVIDPMTQAITDIFGEMHPNCISPTSSFTKQDLIDLAQEAAASVSAGDILRTSTAVGALQRFIENDLNDECQFLGAPNQKKLFYERVNLRLEKLKVRENIEDDSDGDGVIDNEDLCPNSDLSPTVIIDDCGTGIGNSFSESGCSITDEIMTCAEGIQNHGQFVSCVSKVTNDLKEKGTITGQQKGAIQRCAAQASIP